MYSELELSVAGMDIKFVITNSMLYFIVPPPPPHTHTAKPDVDFGSLSGALTATPADGDAGQLCFDISITDDMIVEEPSECFGVSISLPEDERDNIMLDHGSAICCIQDDDSE